MTGDHPGPSYLLSRQAPPRRFVTGRFDRVGASTQCGCAMALSSDLKDSMVKTTRLRVHVAPSQGSRGQETVRRPAPHIPVSDLFQQRGHVEPCQRQRGRCSGAAHTWRSKLIFDKGSYQIYSRSLSAVRRSASRLFGPRMHADELSIWRTPVQFLEDEGCMESQSLATASCGLIPSSWKPSWQVAFHFIALFLP
jgi:hypothetical protein